MINILSNSAIISRNVFRNSSQSRSSSNPLLSWLGSAGNFFSQHGNNFTTTNTPSSSRKVGVMGASGRVGSELIHIFKEKGINTIVVPRQIVSGTVPQKEKFCVENEIDLMINAGGKSDGKTNTMREANVLQPLEMAKVLHKIGKPIIHLSSTATKISGLSEVTPYALTKQEAEDALKYYATIVSMDVLIGKSDKIDIGSLAGAGAHIKGQRQWIQPTTYTAACKTIGNIAYEILEGNKVPHEIIVAGHPIELGEFVRLINKVSFELHMCPQTLLKLAELVQNGSLTPEFIHLANLSDKQPIIHETDTFEYFHDDPIPTHEELAHEIKKTSFIEHLKLYAKIYKESPHKIGLVKNAISIIKNSAFKF